MQATKSPGKIPRYHESLDFEKLWADFAPAPEYFQSSYIASPEETRALQEARFKTQLARAWSIPFYQRLWGEKGIEPGDIRGLEDLEKLPVFSVHDLRASIERNPPWGDYFGIDPQTDDPMPLVLQTSGGTTGLPRAMMYSPKDREVMNIITGRRLHMQGVRPYDLVQVALSVGMPNGGLLAREGIWKYSGAIPLMTGSGAQTPTRRQIEIMKSWKTSFIAGFPAYLRHMAVVARDEMGIDVRELGIKGLLVHLGTEDRSAIESLWNAPAYDTYGCNEFGSLAVECEHQNGMHIFEDAFHIEILDPDTLSRKNDGEKGTIVVTDLFKYIAPLIRFNMNDISAVVAGQCACGTCQRSLQKIYGRADNMVKFKGTNIFPEAVGALVAENPAASGEYVCIVSPAGETDEEMSVQVEAADPSVDFAALEKSLAARFKEALGVKLAVKAVAPHALAEITEVGKATKARRLIDQRKK